MREKKLLVRIEHRSFYDDGTYRCDHWPASDYSEWMLDEEGKTWMFKHAFDGDFNRCTPNNCGGATAEQIAEIAQTLHNALIEGMLLGK